MKQIHCKRKGKSFASRFPGMLLSATFRRGNRGWMGISDPTPPSRKKSKRGVSFVRKMIDAVARQEMIEKFMKNAFKKDGM